jgi:hypothetical protein
MIPALPALPGVPWAQGRSRARTVLIDGSNNNGGFETAGAGGADVFASWGEVTSNGTVSSEGVTVRSGSASCKLVPNASAGCWVQQTSRLVVGRLYEFSVWVNSSVTATLRIGSGSGGTPAFSVTSGSWQNIRGTFVANSATFAIVPQAAGTFYLDDLEVWEV